ncbi:hypothetical protein [Streptomyces sp. NPDC086838]|uniref:hypothetical protein n=1 Tax=Streptomyces sp. NPDC086838 TaxID=3365762 RepID=UPI0037F683CC
MVTPFEPTRPAVVENCAFHPDEPFCQAVTVAYEPEARTVISWVALPTEAGTGKDGAAGGFDAVFVGSVLVPEVRFGEAEPVGRVEGDAEAEADADADAEVEGEGDAEAEVEGDGEPDGSVLSSSAATEAAGVSEGAAAESSEA